MNTFALGVPRPHVTKRLRYSTRFSVPLEASTDVFRPPLGESTSAGNRGKRPATTTPRPRGRPKKARTDPEPSSTPLNSSSLPPSSTPPSSPQWVPTSGQPPRNASEDASDPPSDPPLDPLLGHVPEDFFEPVLFDEDDDFYQVPARLENFIACHPYTRDIERHHLGPMDQICDHCGAASWKGEKKTWCCDKGRTKVTTAETIVDQDDRIAQDVDEDDETGEGRAETDLREPVGEDEKGINDILHSLKEGTTTLTDDCKEFRRHSVQYNNSAAMASQQVTIDHSVAPYTCKIQGSVTTHMPALAPPEGERSVFGQIYVINSTQEQATFR